MMRIVTALVLVLIILSVALPAWPQAQCGRHDEVAAELARQFGERVVAQGVSSDGRLTEIWANQETGSWTITTTLPNGMVCLRDAGVRFNTAKPGEPA